MTTGYLWTGQYEEAKRVIEKGNNQSMELDENSIDGHWSTDVNNGMDFFIINDAIFSKLCILGEDVEPCFEGASVTAPNVSSTFSKVDNGFKQTLFTMMQDLKFALEGGKGMEIDEREVAEEINEEVKPTEEVVETPVEEPAAEEESVDVEAASEESVEETPASDFAAEDDKEEEEKEDGDKVEETPSEEPEVEEENADEEPEETTVEEAVENVEEDVEESSVEEPAEDYAALKASYSELETKYEELLQFKKQVEDKEKVDLINSFYMLSEDDKKDVKEHLSEYSLEEIESKLSVICVRKKVNFEKENSDKNESTVEEEKSDITTFSVEENGSSIPAWISACINTQNSKNN